MRKKQIFQSRYRKCIYATFKCYLSCLHKYCSLQRTDDQVEAYLLNCIDCCVFAILRFPMGRIGPSPWGSAAAFHFRLSRLPRQLFVFCCCGFRNQGFIFGGCCFRGRCSSSADTVFLEGLRHWRLRLLLLTFVFGGCGFCGRFCLWRLLLLRLR